MAFILLQIQDIIRMSHLLTIFRVSENSLWDLDVAILQALLKGRNMFNMTELTKGVTLMLLLRKLNH